MSHDLTGPVSCRYQRVQSALTQQSSELQDTRMLTEFLERVELEESQDPSQYRLAQVGPPSDGGGGAPHRERAPGSRIGMD